MNQFLKTLSELEQKTLLAVISMAGCGVIATLAGAVGLLFPLVSLILLIPFYFTLQTIRLVIHDSFSKTETLFQKLSITLFAFTILSHFVGVLLPETGFDALWYHLPLIKAYVEQHRLVFHPDFYQSLYPQFGDMLFTLGFQIAGVLGAKLMAFWFGVLLLLVCYTWIRRFCDQTWSVLMVTVIALFQVVSWQMSSAYVDVVSALWLVTGAWVLLRESGRVLELQSSKVSKLKRGKSEEIRQIVIIQLLLASFLFGCFFATKFINLGSFPLIIGLLTWKLWSVRQLLFSHSGLRYFAGVSVLTSIVFAMTSGFWFLRAYAYTGNFLYPMGSEHAEPVVGQMGVSGWSEWLSLRATTIYRLPVEFVFKNDGYATLLIPIFTGIIFYLVKQGVKIDSQWWICWLIGVYGLLFWWFFPPPSTRYVLGQIIVAFIGLAVVVGQNLESNKTNVLRKWKNAILGFVMLSIVSHLAIRLAVNTRGIPYLLGIETQQQYLNRFRNGFTDEKINAWYGTN